MQERPLLTPPTHIPLSTPHSSHTRATQTEQLSTEEFHPRVSLDFLSCNGPTLSNTRCMCERHGETYECFKCLHMNICMHKTSHEAFHQNHSTGDTDAYSGASAMHACCPTERARKVLPTSQTLNVSLMKVLPSILLGFGVFTCARRGVRCYFACVTVCFPPESWQCQPKPHLARHQERAKDGKARSKHATRVVQVLTNTCVSFLLCYVWLMFKLAY